MERRLKNQASKLTAESSIEIANPTNSSDILSLVDNSINLVASDVTSDVLIVNTCDMKKEEGCQADIFVLCADSEKTFICNRYIYGDNSCDAEIQTEIHKPTGVVIINNTKKLKSKTCGTPQKVFIHRAVGPDSAVDEISDNKLCFQGSVTNDEQLTDLAGVSFDHFNFLIKKLDTTEKIKISKEIRLLIFLFKMKTGLTFSAISAIFSVHRTTVSRIFHAILENLVNATGNLVFWPDKQSVQATMPECFKPQYSQTRVIIDCTELRIDIPSAVDTRVYCYSRYKKGFTAKVLIGITPGGFISFKSPAAGGRKSDSQITIQSGLINLLEGDVVLADKGFPEIKTILDTNGRNVILVMPPFLEKKSEFSKEETEETYTVAKVRIHVERIMQRLRTYHILNKIPEHLFDCIDDIIHMCCVLVNLQPPIFADKTAEKKS